MEEKKFNKVYLVVILLLTAFMIYYAVMLSMAPGKKMSELNSEFGQKPPEKGEFNENVFKDSTYLSLLKEKSFLQSRATLAETDSIYLTINLKDSITRLEISGVTVHAARIGSYDMSGILEKGDRNIIYNLLSTPLEIATFTATIQKEPVMVKIAPKDTSEYQPDIIPDTSINEPVNYKLELTNGMRIYVYQVEEEKKSDRKSIFRFDLRERLGDTWISLKSVAHFRIPEYHPYIKIRIPRDDSKIIFRAIPRKGQIAVYT
ncbi:MAG TPA: hypothetical protein VK213_08205 [Bacteroidales bacterium]|nr:hypothetical protein [Bacteroidales bacterium]